MWREKASVFFVVLSLLKESQGASSADDDHDHHSSPSWISLTTAVLCLVTFILLLTIIFERLKEAIHASATEVTEPIIASMFEEMTVLGFISVVVFVLLFSGLLEDISAEVFGDDEHNRELLYHMLEILHYGLSFIMITFLLHVLFLSHASKHSVSKWRALDKVAQNEVEMCELREFLRSTKLLPSSFFERARVLKHRKRALQILRFHSVRKEFIEGRQLFYPYDKFPADSKDRLPEDFDYGYYLALCLGSYLSEVIDVGILEWSAMWFVVVVWYSIVTSTGRHEPTHAWEAVGLYYIWTAVVLLFAHHTSKLRDKVANPSDFKGLLIPEDNSTLRRYADDDEFTDPVWAAHARLDGKSSDMEQGKKRPVLRREQSALHRLAFGKAPNAYLQIFLFKENGPRLQSAIYTIHVLGTSLYLALFSLHFARIVYLQQGLGAEVLYVILAVAPVIYLVLRVEVILLRRIAALDSLGSLRKTSVVGRVLRSQKTSRALRALVLMQGMKKTVLERQFHACVPVISPQSSEEKQQSDDPGVQMICTNQLEAAIIERNLSRDNGSEATGETVKADVIRRSSHTVVRPSRSHRVGIIHPHADDVARMFDLYDTDGNGTIDRTEMSSLLSSLGFHLNDAQLERMYRLVDTDGDGTVSRQEFMAWHLVETAAEDFRAVTPKSLAKELFDLFESDERGITVEQFKEGLDRFNAGLSIDEVACIVRDLDTNSDGRIDIKGFEELLEKYTSLDERDLEL